MSRVRVLVGTRKGAFILTSDGKRQKWDVSGPHFAGWEIYHMKGSPADPNRIYASQTSGWFGQIIQRSDDGGKTWTSRARRPGRQPTPEGCPRARATSSSTTLPKPASRSRRTSGTTARSIRGNSSASGISSRRSPIPTRSMPGVEDAALFRSTDGGKTWQELAGLARHGTGPQWQPGAGGMGLHTIMLDPKESETHVHRDLGGGRVPHG